MKLYRCNICGNIVELIVKGKGTLVCCNENMEELVAKTDDVGNEKHVPVVTYNNNILTVNVGSIEHPMEENHHIEFIIISYNNKTKRIDLNPSDKPVGVFEIDENVEEIEVYEYCNVHGLWKSTFKNNI